MKKILIFITSTSLIILGALLLQTNTFSNSNNFVIDKAHADTPVLEDGSYGSYQQGGDGCGGAGGGADCSS